MRCNLQNLTNKSMAEFCGLWRKFADILQKPVDGKFAANWIPHKHFSLTRLVLKPNPPQKPEKIIGWSRSLYLSLIHI